MRLARWAAAIAKLEAMVCVSFAVENEAARQKRAAGCSEAVVDVT